jgi:transketolase
MGSSRAWRCPRAHDRTMGSETETSTTSWAIRSHAAASSYLPTSTQEYHRTLTHSGRELSGQFRREVMHMHDEEILTTDLQRIARRIRLEVVRMAAEVGSERRAHPGSALSIVDLLVALYYRVMKVDPAHSAWPDRDRLVLSKGQACLALYAVLADLGFFHHSHLHSLRRLNSILQGHPDMRRTPGVDATTGSLGNGLPFGVGMALAAMMESRGYRTYVILGDGEMQEGVVWEGAQLAAKYRLDKLAAIIDVNRWQSCGSVRETMPYQDIQSRWNPFGWHTLVVDGHDFRSLMAGFEAVRQVHGKPTAVLAMTRKGKGISFMEDNNAWHQRHLTAAELAAAEHELRRGER